MACNFLFLLPYPKKKKKPTSLRSLELISTLGVVGINPPKTVDKGKRTTWHFFAESGAVAAATSVPAQSTARTGEASPPYHTLA